MFAPRRSLKLYRISATRGTSAGRSGSTPPGRKDRSFCLICTLGGLRNRVYMNRHILRAEFVVRVELFLVFVPEIAKSLELMRLQKCLDWGDRYQWPAVVFSTFHEIVVFFDALANVASDAIQAESMPTLLLAIAVNRCVADITEDWGSIPQAAPLRG